MRARAKAVRAALLGMALLAASPAVAEPGDMSAAAFLAKADALRAKGPMALLSGDIKLLKAEGQAAGLAYRARLKAEKAAGKSPHSCPPSKSRINSTQVIEHLRAYSPATRARTTMKAAISDLMVKTYPCG